MNKKITIVLNETPPSTNNVWRHAVIKGFGRTYLTKEGKQFKERTSKKVPECWKITEKPIRMRINLIFPTKRRTDIDNYCKVLLDSWEGKIYEDDKQIVELHITKCYEKGISRTVVTIEELKEECREMS